MKNAILAALLAAAPALAPGLAAAQQPNASRTQPLPNQTNLQGQANQQQQPGNARETTSGPAVGQANTIPTPPLHNQNTPIR
jgi:hypothetical protein